ncbi:MAG: hypothetical protein CMC57_01580 [Flavobacteriaceae bacterium]|nr:hypothetical protein [Flavobacteriaceae bacterium]|tara:strand:- start:204 stop:758 length:555 start_codon:yes stop_codon:yes gene_type:complete
MLDKLEIELKEIAKKILNSNESIDLDQISRDILVLYEKIIIYKHSIEKQPNILKTNELIKNIEFKTSKKTLEKKINLSVKEKVVSNDKIQKENQNKEDHKITKNLNDQFAKEIQIDLNDKNAFIKHLFNENETIYERSIQEMKGFKNFAQVKKIIDRIKKFHNNWEGKESYEKRFIYLLQKNFR